MSQDIGVSLPYSPNSCSYQEMVESKSAGLDSTGHRHDYHRGLFVDRGVGNSPKTVRSESAASLFGRELMLDTETEVCHCFHE
jgi:6-phosphofructo-2-kinase/fructose-2,6-biphosphatase